MTPERHADQMADSGHTLDRDPDSTQRRILRAVAHVTGPLEARIAALEKALKPGGKAAKASEESDKPAHKG